MLDPPKGTNTKFCTQVRGSDADLPPVCISTHARITSEVELREREKASGMATTRPNHCEGVVRPVPPSDAPARSREGSVDPESQ